MVLAGVYKKVTDYVEILAKNRNVGQKSKFGKNPNFSQKCKFRPKTKILETIQILAKNPKLNEKSKFSSKIKFLGKNQNFGHNFQVLH